MGSDSGGFRYPACFLDWSVVDDGRPETGRRCLVCYCSRYLPADVRWGWWLRPGAARSPLWSLLFAFSFYLFVIIRDGRAPTAGAALASTPFFHTVQLVAFSGTQKIWAKISLSFLKRGIFLFIKQQFLKVLQCFFSVFSKKKRKKKNI